MFLGWGLQFLGAGVSSVCPGCSCIHALARHRRVRGVTLLASRISGETALQSVATSLWQIGTLGPASIKRDTTLQLVACRLPCRRSLRRASQEILWRQQQKLTDRLNHDLRDLTVTSGTSGSAPGGRVMGQPVAEPPEERRSVPMEPRGASCRLRQLVSYSCFAICYADSLRVHADS
jgi:hypothetical protein